ncbi:MAG TPA: TIGR02281 family clan AA aspartic protease [Mesorhizobium sp.]|jgi:aspartyl protease family protein
MLRNLLILAIFAALSASVSISYQSNPQLFERLLSSATSRETGVAKPAEIKLAARESNAATPQPAGRKVLVPSDGRGHYVAAFKLNGRQVDALIDTGATLVAINTSTARRIGISLSTSDFNQSVSTANGVTRAAIVNLDTLQIGKIAIDDVQAVVLDDKALQTNLIGMSFLNRLGKFQAQDSTLLLVQ